MAELTEDELCLQLAGLGYPGFAYMGGNKNADPTEVVLRIFFRPGVCPRLLSGVPWVLSTQDLDWPRLVNEAKSHNRQNSFGYFVSLARRLAESQNRPVDSDRLLQWETVLYDMRLNGEDDMQDPTMSEDMKEWLKLYRPREAAYWGVLYNTTFDDLKEHSTA